MKFINGYNIGRISGVYKIKNIIDNRVYIGIASNMYKRYSGHKYMLTKGNHYNIKLQNFVNKYGINKLIFEIVLVVTNKTILVDKEIEFIKQFNSIKEGFNIIEDSRKMAHIDYKLSQKISSQKRKGMPLSKEWKEHISEAKKLEYKINGHHLKGTKWSEDRRNKMIDENGLKHITKESRIKSSISNKGISRNKKNKIYNRLLKDDVIKNIKLDILNKMKRKDIINKYFISIDQYKGIKTNRYYKDIKL